MIFGWLRRRRIAAMLAELPESAQVSRVRVKAGDAVVIECSHRLSAEQVDRIGGAVRGAIPGVKILILDAGMTLKVVQP